MEGVCNWFLGRGFWEMESGMECPLAELMGTPVRDCDNNNTCTFISENVTLSVKSRLKSQNRILR